MYPPKGTCSVAPDPALLAVFFLSGGEIRPSVQRSRTGGRETGGWLSHFRFFFFFFFSGRRKSHWKEKSCKKNKEKEKKKKKGFILFFFSFSFAFDRGLHEIRRGLRFAGLHPQYHAYTPRYLDRYRYIYALAYFGLE